MSQEGKAYIVNQLMFLSLPLVLQPDIGLLFKPNQFHDCNNELCNRRDGIVARAFASQSVDLGFISLVELYQKSLIVVFTVSLLGAKQNRDSVENKPASLLIVSLGKALNEMPPSLCGRQMMWPSSLPVVVAQSDERHANRA